jgi:hypothetical protein
MVACCSHHLTDVLPIVGFAGAVSKVGSVSARWTGHA